MEKIYFGQDDDIINPCWDNVFKAIFTKDTPASRGALKMLLSAMTGRSLSIVAITTNEPSILIRLDFDTPIRDGFARIPSEFCYWCGLGEWARIL